MPVVPRRNPRNSDCEIRKSVRDSFGVPRTIEVVAIVKGVDQAEAAVGQFTRELADEEKSAGVFFCWDYTARRHAQGESKPLSSGS